MPYLQTIQEAKFKNRSRCASLENLVYRHRINDATIDRSTDTRGPLAYRHFINGISTGKSSFFTRRAYRSRFRAGNEKQTHQK